MNVNRHIHVWICLPWYRERATTNISQQDLGGSWTPLLVWQLTPKIFSIDWKETGLSMVHQLAASKASLSPDHQYFPDTRLWLFAYLMWSIPSLVGDVFNSVLSGPFTTQSVSPKLPESERTNIRVRATQTPGEGLGYQSSNTPTTVARPIAFSFWANFCNQLQCRMQAKSCWQSVMNHIAQRSSRLAFDISKHSSYTREWPQIWTIG